MLMDGVVAAVVFLVKVDHDGELKWPFQRVITVQILNHVTNSAQSMVRSSYLKWWI